MRRLILPVLLGLCLGWPVPAAAQAAQTNKDNAELRAMTRQLAAIIRDSFETIYLLSTPLHVDWPARDGRERDSGALVFFSLEGRAGSNGSMVYMAYFQSDRLETDPEDLKRPWKNYRLADFIRIADHAPEWDQAQVTAEGVVIPTKTWRETDPHCCPTGKGAIRVDVDALGRMTVTDISR